MQQTPQIEATMEQPPCWLCGREGQVLHASLRDRHFGVPGEWDILRCRDCECTWLSPLPRAADIAGFYDNYYTHSDRATPTVPTGRARLMKLAVPAVVMGHPLPMTRAERVAARLLSLVGPVRDMAAPLMWIEGKEHGRLLDVGCGNGQLLVRMRALGWEVAGVEPDAAACQVAREACGLEVVTGALAAADLAPEQWDVVTANHVLEHVLDPVAMLQDCARLLRPGGKLVVTTPNIRSLACDHFKSAWLHWDPPRHIHCFGPRALQTCAERAGLEVERVVTGADLARATWWASRRLRETGLLPGIKIEPEGIMQLAQGAAFWLAEYALSRFFACGENLALVARKA